MDLYYLIVTYVLAGVFGLCVGSFLNVVIYRVPNNMSLAKPDSHCPTCKYKLRWYDNIPVISYLILGGKCRSCKTHISFRYTAVELANMVLWLLSAFLFWEKSIPMAIIYAAVSSIFICIFFIDLEHKIIFDRFQIMLLVLAVAAIFFDNDYYWISHVIGGVAGFAVFFLVAWVYERSYGAEGLGGGDIKLVGVVGLLLGWERLLFAIIVATLPAAIIMLFWSKGRSGENREFPFAPFLVTGFTVSMFFGTQIITWYLSLVGI